MYILQAHYLLRLFVRESYNFFTSSVRRFINSIISSSYFFCLFFVLHILEKIEEIKSPYESCLNKLYAKVFVYALNNIEKLIFKLPKDEKNQVCIKKLIDNYRNYFGYLKHIRDSAMHIEDRGRGLNRNKERIDTNLLIIGGFLDNRFTFTGEDGKQYEVEISENTLDIAREIIQKIINSYTWTLL